MVVRHTRTIGFWIIAVGLLVGVFAMMGLQSYVRDRGFLWNLQNQSVVFPFLHGSSPLECMADSFRRLIPNPTGVAHKPEPGCNESTTAPLKAVVAIALFLVIVGVGVVTQKIEEVDPVAARVLPLSKDDVAPPQKTSSRKAEKREWKKPAAGSGGGGDEELEFHSDGPGKPHEGGF